MYNTFIANVFFSSIMNTVTCDGKTLEMRHLANKEELKQFVNLVMADDEHFFNTEKDVLHEWKLFPDAFIGFFNEDGDLIGIYLIRHPYSAVIDFRRQNLTSIDVRF